MTFLVKIECQFRSGDFGAAFLGGGVVAKHFIEIRSFDASGFKIQSQKYLHEKNLKGVFL